jgi:AraC family transcriptional regulator, ethanolamine operon transcriptional activator
LVAEAVEQAFSIVDSSDLDHYRAQPGNWNVQVKQLSKGIFRSLVRSIQLPGITVYDNRWGAPCQVIGQSPDDWLMLGTIVTSGRAGAHWCGQRLGQDVFACTSPGKEIEFSTEQRAHDVVILIQPRLLELTCGSMALEFVREHQHLCFDVLSGSALIELALDLLQRCETQSQLLQQAAIATGVRSNLLRALEECFAGLFVQDLSTPGIRADAFHAAVLHATHAPLQTSAWHMAQAAGVSQKTLEVAFRERIGMTPGRYLTLLRLNGVHHDICELGRSARSISEISQNWGFTNPTRFRAAYRELFGELPSQTLNSLPSV